MNCHLSDTWTLLVKCLIFFLAEGVQGHQALTRDDLEGQGHEHLGQGKMILSSTNNHVTV